MAVTLKLSLLAGLIFTSGCALPGFVTNNLYQPNPQTRPAMTFSKAQKQLLSYLKLSRGAGWVYQDIRVGETEVSYVDPRTAGGGPKTHSWRFADVGSLAVMNDPASAFYTVHVPGDSFVFIKLADAKGFADVVYALSYYAKNPSARLDDDAAIFARFKERADAWRVLPQSPPLPEEARRYEVLAKNAISTKEFKKAGDYYEKGLAIYPLWPKAQYNAAVIFGELGVYDKAVSHMKRYLALCPYAKDAQAARDQMYIWEEKLRGK